MSDLVYPEELTPALRELYGLAWTPWVLRDVWGALREVGHPIARKAEEEGAAAIHFLMPFVLEHGEHWRAKALGRLQELKAEQQSRSVGQEAAQSPAPPPPVPGGGEAHEEERTLSSHSASPTQAQKGHADVPASSGAPADD